jgi:hypothetical protein
MFSMSWLDADTLFPAKGRTFAASRILLQGFSNISPRFARGQEEVLSSDQPTGGGCFSWGLGPGFPIGVLTIALNTER